MGIGIAATLSNFGYDERMERYLIYVRQFVCYGTPLLWDTTTMVKDILEGYSYETKEFGGMSCDC